MRENLYKIFVIKYNMNTCVFIGNEWELPRKFIKKQRSGWGEEIMLIEDINECNKRISDILSINPPRNVNECITNEQLKECWRLVIKTIFWKDIGEYDIFKKTLLKNATNKIMNDIDTMIYNMCVSRLLYRNKY